jgi:hypothetical protein
MFQRSPIAATQRLLVRSFARMAIVLSLGLAVAGCVNPPPPKDYAAFRDAAPRSILIVPAINRSVEVEAPDYFLSTISRPVAERGYYVFPVNVVKHMLEDDGLSDSDLVYQADTRKLASLFDANAVLYITIERWDSQYVVLSTTTTVDLSYVLKSGRTGETLWSEKRKVVYSPQANSGGGIAGLVAQAVVAAIEKAAPNYMPLARQANALAVGLPHQGLPAGPYRDGYKNDSKDF